MGLHNSLGMGGSLKFPALTIIGHDSPLSYGMNFEAVKNRIGGGELRKAWPLAVPKQDKLVLGGGGGNHAQQPGLSTGSRNTE